MRVQQGKRKKISDLSNEQFEKMQQMRAAKVKWKDIAAEFGYSSGSAAMNAFRIRKTKGPQDRRKNYNTHLDEATYKIIGEKVKATWENKTDAQKQMFAAKQRVVLTDVPHNLQIIKQSSEAELAEKIKDLRNQGYTFTKIGEMLGCTKQNANQIYHRHYKVKKILKK